jgi:hypothetical protein
MTNVVKHTGVCMYIATTGFRASASLHFVLQQCATCQKRKQIDRASHEGSKEILK